MSGVSEDRLASFVFRIFLLAAFILGAAAISRAQGDDPTSLSVTANGNYRWQLDGVDQGRITAGHAAIVHTTKGQHLVEATDSEGHRVFSQKVQIIMGQRASVRITSTQPEKTPATHTPSPSQLPGKPPLSVHADMQGVWSDHATSLMWTAKDSGAPVLWDHAGEYCSSLRLGGYSDWRLPRIEELRGLSDPSAGRLPECRDSISGDAFTSPVRIRKEIDLGCYWVWSSTRGRDVPMRGGPAPTIMMFNFYNGVPSQSYTKEKQNRALCVRGGAAP